MTHAEFEWEIRENIHEPIIASGISLSLDKAKEVCKAILKIEDCGYAEINDESSVVAVFENGVWTP